jgi:hypothetical protein
MWDPNGHVLVRQRNLIKRHEGSSRHSAHRVKHRWVIHTGPPSRRYQLLQQFDLVAARRIVPQPHSSILAQPEEGKLHRMPRQYPGTTVELGCVPASGLPITWKAEADEIAQQHEENNDRTDHEMNPRSRAAQAGLARLWLRGNDRDQGDDHS